MSTCALTRFARLALIALLALAVTAAFVATPFPGFTIPNSLLRA